MQHRATARARNSWRRRRTHTSATAWRERGNALFSQCDYAAAAACYSAALDCCGLCDDSSEATAQALADSRATLLINRSNAHYSLGRYELSRDDALAALAACAHHPKALYRLSLAELQLRQPAAALAALAVGAARNASQFGMFTRAARQQGAWRLAPPLSLELKAEDAHVAVLTVPSRAALIPFVERGEPVVIRGFADVSGWSWSELIAQSRAAEAAGAVVEGDVLVSATGVVPDYCRPAEAHASRVETMASRKMRLSELFTRVSSGTTEDEHLPLAPALCRFERVYAYGRGWMLADAKLRQKARDSWPPFLQDGDLVGNTHAEDANAGKPGHEKPGAICWVGSEGSLTPLRYDCSDGLLAQVLGEKRVWLYAPSDAPHLYLRGSSQLSGHPGLDNWERQSAA